MTDEHAADLTPSDECYRCGYDLRGVADEQPCTECGLLAHRSRRRTDELHDTRPGWLRRLSLGVWLILAAIGAGFCAPVFSELADQYARRSVGAVTSIASLAAYTSIHAHGAMLGVDFPALLFVTGIFLLTSREGYPPADRADRNRRRVLRAWALLPLLVVAGLHVVTQLQVNALASQTRRPVVNDDTIFLIGVGLIVALSPLPVLLYLQLRSLAKRARSAYLAEHRLIVGIGNAATLLYAPVVALLAENAQRWGLGTHWTSRSSGWIAVMAALAVSAVLFGLWNFYLLVSFAIAFARASRKLRRQWAQADRAAGETPDAPPPSPLAAR